MVYLKKKNQPHLESQDEMQLEKAEQKLKNSHLKSILNPVEFLKKITLFSDLKENEEALAFFYSFMKDRRFRCGQDIFVEGEAGAELFLLLSGEAEVFRKTLEGDQYKIAVLKSSQGVFFGEGGLLEAEARTATICAVEESHCLVLSRKEFIEIAKIHPEWAFPVLMRISRAVLHRMRKTNQDMILLYEALISEIRGK